MTTLASNQLLLSEWDFDSQKKFDECRSIRLLPFDFYLPKINMCVEYDGIQHFNGWRGDKKSLEGINKRDNIKNKFCISNDIRLLRIHYKDFNNVQFILEALLYEEGLI
jgi:very-short-patch-repair endonuclease